MGKESNRKEKQSFPKNENDSSFEIKSKKPALKSETAKKIWDSNDLLNAMKPSNNELQFRKQKQNKTGLQKQAKFFKCTKCLSDLRPILEKSEKAPSHPCLYVLMCKNCRDYYEDGEFSLDSDGEDKYCRWCGEGGTILACSKCICGFCSTCIRRHLGVKYYRKVQKDDNWLCFFCNPEPLWNLRYICSLAAELSENKELWKLTFGSASSGKENIVKEKENIVNEKENIVNEKENIVNEKENIVGEKETTASGEDLNSESSVSSENFYEFHSRSSKNKTRKRIYSSSSDESEQNEHECPAKKLNLSDKSFETNKNTSFEDIKANALNELEKILNLSKYQMNFGVDWCTKKLEKLNSPQNASFSQETLVNECKKIKLYLSLVSSFLVQFTNSVDSVEKSLLEDNQQKVSSNFQCEDQSSYFAISKFLSFANNQVQTFMEKGISLSTILNAEVYDDGDIIGIRQKNKSSDETSNQSCNTACVTSQPNKSKRESNSQVQSSSNSAVKETIDAKRSEQKVDILEILSILENA